MSEAENNEAAAPAAAAPATKERVEQVVTLKDGRVQTFVGKRKLLKDTIIEGDVVSVRLDFINGETRLFACPPTLLLKAAGHGLEQKLGDEVAGVSDVDDQVMAIDELIERLAEGPDGWTTKRESSGIAGTSVLFKALCEAYPNRTPEELKTFLKGKNQGEKLALRNSARLKPIVERIENEKAAGANVNTEALLGELD